jgi:hypothetical protein
MRDAISLIANSGLQFYRFQVRIDSAAMRSAKFRFFEQFDVNRMRYWLDEVVLINPERGEWARKSQLESAGFLSRQGQLSDEIDFAKIDVLQESDFYEIGNINQVLKALEHHWIPIPFFKTNNINEEFFGPTDWVRLYFEKKQDDVLHLVLLIDTTTDPNPDQLVSPELSENPNENVFSICGNDNLVISYLDSLKGGGWVDEYISGFFNPPNADIERPFLKHIGSYVFFMRFLRSLGKLPQIHLLSDTAGAIDVDLVIDVGNSNTCALLFENPTDQHFNFNAVKRLTLQDLSQPLLCHEQSFSTRLVFTEPTFGSTHSDLNQNNKFQWPSAVRIGVEAERIINDADVELRLSREIRSFNSSPKRYLWDDRPATTEWEFHANQMGVPRRVYKRGISEQLNSDGSPCNDQIFGSRSLFSRKSLMTFVFLEIYTQAIRQINSVEFRSLHGQPNSKRRLKRVLISCPTAMIRQEQIALRGCASEALTLIKRYSSFHQDSNYRKDAYDQEVEIIPSVKDLKLDLQQLDQRKEWIYDEATSAQLVFLYAMIRHKFNGNPELLFNLYGRSRSSLNPYELPKSLTIASLDIGGGTSDLMICRYTASYSEITELTPDPLFWESFSLAGDDLLKEVIQQVIIEGQAGSESDSSCSGVLENYGRKKGIADIGRRLNGFFGKDSNNIGYKGKLMRVSFMNQIAIPIALRYLDQANRQGSNRMTYEELFPQAKPSVELLRYFEAHFGFKFEELVWDISSEKVNEVIQHVFSKLIRQVSSIIGLYGTDLVILSGRPCAFEAIERLFLRYHPVSPNRLFNLNRHWIGRWYPFSDDNGYVQDPKTIVSVGCLISLMAGSYYKLGSFRLNTLKLKTKLISTADYIGPIKEGFIEEVTLSPTRSEGSIVVHHLPFQIGFKSLDAALYPVRNLYTLTFNDERIREALGRRTAESGSSDQIRDAVEKFKLDVRKALPLRVLLTREIDTDKEVVKLQELTDVEGKELSKSYFNLSLHSLADQDGYWLDSGEFTLNTRS